MPPQLTWLHRLPTIMEQIANLPCPVVDRSVIEQIFQLQRRRAHHLLAEFGAYQIGAGRGRTLVLTRDELLGKLQALTCTGQFQRVRQQKRKLAASLLESREHFKHKRVVIPIDPRQRSQGRHAWPPTLRLMPRRLEIDFASPQDLAGQLALVALAFQDELEVFESGHTPSPLVSPPAGTSERDAVDAMFSELETLERAKKTLANDPPTCTDEE